MANEEHAGLPREDADPRHAPDGDVESELGSVVEEQDAGGGQITVFDRADRLAVEHDTGRASARADMDEDEDEDDERALD